MANGEILNREYLAERDLRIFNMKKGGASVTEIARRMNMTVKAVNSAVKRQLDRLNREAALAYPEVLRLELERLDTLQAAIWPQTQHRRVTLDDGTQVDVEPDTKAIQQVLAIMAQRAKLMGLDAPQVNYNIDATELPTPVLAGLDDGPAAHDAFNPETEARQLLEVMATAGVIDQATVDALLHQPALPAADEPVDAEIIEQDTP
jgi:hypothetical protein